MDDHECQSGDNQHSGRVLGQASSVRLHATEGLLKLTFIVPASAPLVEERLFTFWAAQRSGFLEMVKQEHSGCINA